MVLGSPTTYSGPGSFFAGISARRLTKLNSSPYTCSVCGALSDSRRSRSYAARPGLNPRQLILAKSGIGGGHLRRPFPPNERHGRHAQRRVPRRPWRAAGRPAPCRGAGCARLTRSLPLCRMRQLLFIFGDARIDHSADPSISVYIGSPARTMEIRTSALRTALWRRQSSIGASKRHNKDVSTRHYPAETERQQRAAASGRKTSAERPATPATPTGLTSCFGARRADETEPAPRPRWFRVRRLG